MADEFDRKYLPGIVQDAFAIYLGAAFKSVEMMKDPQQSMSTMLTEMKALVTVPDDAEAGVQGKAQALAAVWMEKGANLLQQCKTAGEKFTA